MTTTITTQRQANRVASGHYGREIRAFATKGRTLIFPGVTWLGSLEIRGAGKAVFPDLLIVTDDLAITNAGAILEAPKLVEVGETLSLTTAGLRWDNDKEFDSVRALIKEMAQQVTFVPPVGLRVAGELFDPVEFDGEDEVLSYNRVPLANDQSYSLAYVPETRCIVAGCRTFRTVSAATKHWTERANCLDPFTRNRGIMFAFTLIALREDIERLQQIRRRK